VANVSTGGENMASRIRVQCINKTNRTSHWERISHIGGQNSDGNRWKLSESQAIADIEADKYAFYVEVPRNPEVEVVIAVGPGGRKYLKTKPDGDIPNNLLSLPECP
jgi:hypothetical protein